MQMKIGGSTVAFFAITVIGLFFLWLTIEIYIYAASSADAVIPLQIITIPIVLGCIIWLPSACASLIIDEKGVCKEFFSLRFRKTGWNEIMEIGVHYPHYLVHHPHFPDISTDDIQIYFSKKVKFIEHCMPSIFLEEKDAKSYFLIPYTKEREEFILTLAEKANPSLKSKFRDFPFDDSPEAG